MRNSKICIEYHHFSNMFRNTVQHQLLAHSPRLWRLTTDHLDTSETLPNVDQVLYFLSIFGKEYKELPLQFVAIMTAILSTVQFIIYSET